TPAPPPARATPPARARSRARRPRARSTRRTGTAWSRRATRLGLLLEHLDAIAVGIDERDEAARRHVLWVTRPAAQHRQPGVAGGQVVDTEVHHHRAGHLRHSSLVREVKTEAHAVGEGALGPVVAGADE